MNMARKQPACPDLQHCSVPAGGRSRLDAPWLGRIRSTTEQSRGATEHRNTCECKGGRITSLKHDFRGTNSFSLLLLIFITTLRDLLIFEGATLINSRIQNTYFDMVQNKEQHMPSMYIHEKYKPYIRLTVSITGMHVKASKARGEDRNWVGENRTWPCR